jgi:hypothetical protein
MTTAAFDLHRRPFERMLNDLAIEAPSVTVDAESALTVGYLRRLTEPPGNQTLAEGLASGLKIAAAALGELP